MKRIISFAVAFLLFISCTNHSEKKSDVGISIADSLLNKIETVPQYAAITDSSKLMVTQRDGKSIAYPAYKKLFDNEGFGIPPSFKWNDLDGDGNNEIVSSSYTGGAHCCDVNTILRRTGENEMEEVLDFTGGATISKDTVSLSFYEALGYFHTCYACGVEYPKDAGPVANLMYKNGKFSFFPLNQALNADIETNLKFITAKGIPNKDSEDESGFDDGTRKAVAFNIVGYYFNNRDMKATQNLFDKYYSHKDKPAIWKDIAENIRHFDSTIQQSALMR